MASREEKGHDREVRRPNNTPGTKLVLAIRRRALAGNHESVLVDSEFGVWRQRLGTVPNLWFGLVPGIYVFSLATSNLARLPAWILVREKQATAATRIKRWDCTGKQQQ